jgi:hypothetical protein
VSSLDDESPAALRVLADELLERGDAVHGELIQLQCARGVRDVASAREETLLGVLRKRVRERVGAAFTGDEWRGGFLRKCTLVAQSELSDELVKLSRLSVAARLESVSVRGDVGGLEALFASAPRAVFPRLRAFHVMESRVLGGPGGDASLRIGDVEPMYAAWPSLEVLQLDGYGHRLGALVLPRLRQFSAGELSTGQLPALCAAQWPALESLSLTFLGDASDSSVFEPLLETRFGEALRQVTLISAPWRNWLESRLPRSPLGRGRKLTFTETSW